MVSFTKLEGRARDKVAMVTTTRQMQRPQLTMVTVPGPRPLPYLHVDSNPICTPLRAWTASNAFSLRWARGPLHHCRRRGSCRGLCRSLWRREILQSVPSSPRPCRKPQWARAGVSPSATASSFSQYLQRPPLRASGSQVFPPGSSRDRARLILAKACL